MPPPVASPQIAPGARRPPGAAWRLAGAGAGAGAAGCAGGGDQLLLLLLLLVVTVLLLLLLLLAVTVLLLLRSLPAMLLLLVFRGLPQQMCRRQLLVLYSAARCFTYSSCRSHFRNVNTPGHAVLKR